MFSSYSLTIWLLASLTLTTYTKLTNGAFWPINTNFAQELDNLEETNHDIRPKIQQ